MATIKKYTKSNGETGYMTNLYLGIDPVTGKKKRTTLRASTQRELKLKIARLQIKIENEGFETEQSKTSTFEDIYELWKHTHELGIRASTLIRLEGLFNNHILPHFGDKMITKINSEFCQKQLNNWVSYYTNYKVVKAYTQNVFDYAIKMKVLDNNPMRNTIMPKKKKSKKSMENFYTKEEFLNFLTCLEKEGNYQNYALFHLLVFSGMRKGELGALTWDDVSFKNKSIRINKSMTYLKSTSFPVVTPPKNDRSNRVVFLDDDTISILKKWKTKQAEELMKIGEHNSPNSNYLFTRFNSKFELLPLDADYSNNVLRRMIKKYHLKKITVHGFRHTHATLAFEAGLSVIEVQERLGHESAQITTDTYGHVTQNGKREATNKLISYAKDM